VHAEALRTCIQIFGAPVFLNLSIILSYLVVAVTADSRQPQKIVQTRTGIRVRWSGFYTCLLTSVLSLCSGYVKSAWYFLPSDIAYSSQCTGVPR
jgi:hypothetical protein